MKGASGIERNAERGWWWRGSRFAGCSRVSGRSCELCRRGAEDHAMATREQRERLSRRVCRRVPVATSHHAAEGEAMGGQAVEAAREGVAVASTAQHSTSDRERVSARERGGHNRERW